MHWHFFFSLQLRVTATDQGIPQRSAVVEVQINVLRNLNKPAFRQNLYEVEVDERTAYGTVILNVTADDIDFIDQPGVSGSTYYTILTINYLLEISVCGKLFMAYCLVLIYKAHITRQWNHELENRDQIYVTYLDAFIYRARTRRSTMRLMLGIQRPTISLESTHAWVTSPSVNRWPTTWIRGQPTG